MDDGGEGRVTVRWRYTDRRRKRIERRWEVSGTVRSLRVKQSKEELQNRTRVNETTTRTDVLRVVPTATDEVSDNTPILLPYVRSGNREANVLLERRF